MLYQFMLKYLTEVVRRVLYLNLKQKNSTTKSA